MTQRSSSLYRTLVKTTLIMIGGVVLFYGSVQAVELTKSKRPSARKPLQSTVSKASAENGTSAKLETVRRAVEVQSAGKPGWTKAKTNTTLTSSDKIRTGRQSVARIKMSDGTKVLLLQNSQAEIENVSSLERTIKLIKGRVRAVVTKLKGSKTFAIKTPIGVASVRGTEFEVSFDEDNKNMEVEVKDGEVGVARLGDMADEVILRPGEMIKFGSDGVMGDVIKVGGLAPEQSIRAEVLDSKVKDSIVAMAAEEMKSADYQTGKSLIDVDGTRVRVEQYITRPASNQFKMVSLNEREKRFDYMTYTGTFNTDLPEDLSVALGQVNGKLGSTAPDYYLTDYEMTLSNTVDSVNDGASGGHLVQIDFDGTQYTLTDAADGSNTRTIDAATLQSDGTYKIYNPLKDSYSLVSAADKDDAVKMSVLDNGTYRNLAGGDTYWKTRFNTGSYDINGTVKTAFAQKTSANVLALDLDANFTDAPIIAISEYPDGSGTLHNRLTLYYSDGSKTTYDNYILDDEGNVAPRDAFSGLSSGSAYQTELLKWNYQQKISSTEMQGDINLVIDPKIGTMSGLIQ